MKRLLSTTFTLLLLTSNADPTNAKIDKEKQLRRNKKKAERAAARAEHNHANIQPFRAAAREKNHVAATAQGGQRKHGNRTERHKKQKEAELRQSDMAMTQRTGTLGSTQDNEETSKRDQKKFERDSDLVVTRTNASTNNNEGADHSLTDMIDSNVQSREGSGAADSNAVVVDNGSSSNSNEGSVSKKDIRDQKKAMRNQPQPTKLPTMAPKPREADVDESMTTYTPTYFPTTFIPTSSPTFVGKWGQAFQGPYPKYEYVPAWGGSSGWGGGKSGKGSVPYYKVPYIAPPTEMPTTFMPTTFPPTEDPNATPNPNTLPTYIPTYEPTTSMPTFSPVWNGGWDTHHWAGSGKSDKGDSYNNWHPSDSWTGGTPDWWGGGSSSTAGGKSSKNGAGGGGSSNYGYSTGGKSGKDGSNNWYGPGHMWSGGASGKSGKGEAPAWHGSSHNWWSSGGGGYYHPGGGVDWWSSGGQGWWTGSSGGGDAKSGKGRRRRGRFLKPVEIKAPQQ